MKILSRPLKEKLLLSLSRSPGSRDFNIKHGEWSMSNSLDVLKKEFTFLLKDVTGKRIFDFGCGAGFQAIALAQNGAQYVAGFDTDPDMIAQAESLALKYGLKGRVDFFKKLEPRLLHTFDMVISQDSMEHFTQPIESLKEMRLLMNSKGVVLISFGPPWYAPHGSHMHFFTKIPWVNILFDERTVMNVRKEFRSDGANRYEEVRGGLNRMTVAKFEKLVSESGLHVISKKYRCVKGVNFLGKIPFARELFINNVSCVLSKA